ncbi:MAG TPA: hypothetical protein VK563_22130 [Puia sp.]|nr:hypothetical protein [Puia sp.]
MITRDNYEEFFLLYVDNELSLADRKAVETFAAGDPGLEEELRALLRCRLKPDSHLSFGNPGALLKGSPADETIHALHPDAGANPMDGIPHTYEGPFLSYIDGELDETGRRAVEDLIRQDPSLLRQLELLRQTVSMPDPGIVFENKEVLYKRDSRVRLFGIPPAFFRVAAAAVILLVIGLLIFNRTGKNTAHDLIVQKKDKPPVTAPSTQPVTDQHDAATPDMARSDAAGADTASVVKNDLPGGIAATDNKNKKETVTPRSSGALYSSTGQRARPGEDSGRTKEIAGNDQAAVQKRGGQTTGRYRSPADTRPADPGAKNSGGTVSIVAPDPGSKENPVNSRLSSLAMVTTGSQQPENRLSSFATQALLKDAARDDEDVDDYAMEQPSPKKNKLRGIFRKVSRVFEKTAGSDDPDNKHGVLIGNLQIALK